MVCEYYANAKEHKDLKVYVRGKWIRFDRTIINRFYGLSDINDDDFFRLCEDGAINRTDVIRELAHPDVTWKRLGSDVTNFSS